MTDAKLLNFVFQENFSYEMSFSKMLWRLTVQGCKRFHPPTASICHWCYEIGLSSKSRKTQCNSEAWQNPVKINKKTLRFRDVRTDIHTGTCEVANILNINIVNIVNIYYVIYIYYISIIFIFIYFIYLFLLHIYILYIIFILYILYIISYLYYIYCTII